MKKFFLSIISLSFIFFSSISPLYALDEQIFGNWFGEMVPINYINDDGIMPLATVSGYTVNSGYTYSSGYQSPTSFTAAITLSNLNRLYFIYTIYLPDYIERGKAIDMALKFSTTGLNDIQVDRVAMFSSAQQSQQYANFTAQISNRNTAIGMTLNNISNDSYSSNTILVYFSGVPTKTAFSLSCTEIGITTASSDALLGQVASQLEMIIYLLNNNVVGSLTSILDAWDTYLTELPHWLDYYIRTPIRVGVDAINSAIDTVNTSIINMNNNIATKIDNMSNAIVTKLDDTLVLKDTTDVDNLNNANTNLDSTIQDYDTIDKDLSDDMNTNLDNITPEFKLFGSTSFIKTCQFVSYQLQHIYESHLYITLMTDFSLTLGIILTVIGIQVRRS